MCFYSNLYHHVYFLINCRTYLKQEHEHNHLSDDFVLIKVTSY